MADSLDLLLKSMLAWNNEVIVEIQYLYDEVRNLMERIDDIDTYINGRSSMLVDMSSLILESNMDSLDMLKETQPKFTGKFMDSIKGKIYKFAETVDDFFIFESKCSCEFSGLKESIPNLIKAAEILVCASELMTNSVDILRHTYFHCEDSIITSEMDFDEMNKAVRCSQDESCASTKKISNEWDDMRANLPSIGYSMRYLHEAVVDFKTANEILQSDEANRDWEKMLNKKKSLHHMTDVGEEAFQVTKKIFLDLLETFETLSSEFHESTATLQFTAQGQQRLINIIQNDIDANQMLRKEFETSKKKCEDADIQCTNITETESSTKTAVESSQNPLRHKSCLKGDQSHSQVLSHQSTDRIKELMKIARNPNFKLDNADAVKILIEIFKEHLQKKKEALGMVGYEKSQAAVDIWAMFMKKAQFPKTAKEVPEETKYIEEDLQEPQDSSQSSNGKKEVPVRKYYSKVPEISKDVKGDSQASSSKREVPVQKGSSKEPQLSNNVKGDSQASSGKKEVPVQKGFSKAPQISKDVKGDSQASSSKNEVPVQKGFLKAPQISKDVKGDSQASCSKKEVSEQKGFSKEPQISKNVKGDSQASSIKKEVPVHKGSSEAPQISRNEKGDSQASSSKKKVPVHKGSSKALQISRNVKGDSQSSSSKKKVPVEKGSSKAPQISKDTKGDSQASKVGNDDQHTTENKAVPQATAGTKIENQASKNPKELNANKDAREQPQMSKGKRRRTRKSKNKAIDRQETKTESEPNTTELNKNFAYLNHRLDARNQFFERQNSSFQSRVCSAIKLNVTNTSS